MFNQMEHMIARSEYQQMQQARVSVDEGVEVAAKPGWMRRLWCVLRGRRLSKKEKAPAQRKHPSVAQVTQ